MLTVRQRLFFSWRQKYSELTYASPFKWNLKTQHLKLSSNYAFGFWTFAPLYLTLCWSGTFWRTISHVWTWNKLVHFNKIAFLADLLYVNLILGFNSCMFILLLKRDECVQLTNNLLHLDRHLEGNVVTDIYK